MGLFDSWFADQRPPIQSTRPGNPSRLDPNAGRWSSGENINRGQHVDFRTSQQYQILPVQAGPSSQPEYRQPSSSSSGQYPLQPVSAFGPESRRQIQTGPSSFPSQSGIRDAHSRPQFGGSPPVRPANAIPTMNGLEELRRVIEHPDSPPPSPPPPEATTTTQQSAFSKALDYCKGVMSIDVKLHRRHPEVHNDIGRRLTELGVEWADHPWGIISCVYGQKGTPEYVAFTIQFVIAGAQNGLKDLSTGFKPWFTKVIASKTAGSGGQFRKIAQEVLDAASYQVIGGIRYNYNMKDYGIDIGL